MPRAGREASPSDVTPPGAVAVMVAPSSAAAPSPRRPDGSWTLGECDHRPPRGGRRDGTGRSPGRSGRSPPRTVRRGIGEPVALPRSRGGPLEGSATTAGGRPGSRSRRGTRTPRIPGGIPAAHSRVVGQAAGHAGDQPVAGPASKRSPAGRLRGWLLHGCTRRRTRVGALSLVHRGHHVRQTGAFHPGCPWDDPDVLAAWSGFSPIPALLEL